MPLSKRWPILAVALVLLVATTGASQNVPQSSGASIRLSSTLMGTARAGTLDLDGWFFETASGRTPLPASLTGGARTVSNSAWSGSATTADGRTVTLTVTPQRGAFLVSLKAQPSTGIVRWGVAVDAASDEYFTGLMERVVDGPQQASWAPGITAAMDLRGQKVDMILKPTTSVYAPFYISSRGYGLFVKGTWPGRFDFAATDAKRVQVDFEGPSFDLTVYTATTTAAIVRQHAMEVGPPVLPPRWMYTPWRWRDEHTHRATYYDGTPVTGPFNSEIMEDVLMMKAYGIPSAVYWIDRPWGVGALGYDDFEIDARRLPNFAQMVKWLDSRQSKTMLWIAPFFQGEMARVASERKYTLAGQVRPASGNNFPMVDLTNPAARAYWQSGIEKLLKLGVAGYKLDRAEENIPDDGPDPVFDGRSLREQRNAYPPMYVKAAYEIAKKYRGDDFFVMPRAGYTGSSPYAVFWGGDIGGTQEGLRASIIGVQRSAVMGYPNWGSDTCGYNQQLMEQEVCARWLAFSAFTPIMEVGPTRNVAFWNTPREPRYDEVLIAAWRLYARLHERLAPYTYRLAGEAHRTGMPIVRPLFLADPEHADAWRNWWTYMYGPDLVVSPVWEKGTRSQQVYLPTGSRWRDAWRDTVFQGGQTVTVDADVHQIPIFVRVGANLPIGDLNREWQESVAIAKVKPDLKALDAEVTAWFAKAR